MAQETEQKQNNADTPAEGTATGRAVKTGSKIPILGRYIDSYRLAFKDNRDGLVRSKRGVFFGNYALGIAGQLTAGIFYTELLILLFSGLPEEVRVTTQNSYIALIGALTSVAGLLQLLSPFIFERLRHRKPLIFTFHTMYHVCDILLLPACLFLPFEIGTRAKIFVAVMTLRTATSSLASPAFSAWHIYSMPEYSRSDYYMVNTGLNSVVNPILSLLLGLYLDYFVGHEIALVGILIMRGVALLLIAAEYWNFSHVVEPEYNTGISDVNRLKFTDILLAPIRCKPFLVIVLIAFVYNLGAGMAPFYSTYLVDSAHLSYTYLSIVSLAGLPCSLIMLPFWNKMIHKHGWLPVLAVSMALFAGAHAINGFVTEDTKYMYIVSNVYCQIVCGGYSLGMSNLPFLHIPDDLKTGCLAFYNAMGSLVGVLNAAITQVIQKKTDGKILHLFGLSIENRAYMCFLCFAIIILDAGLIAVVAFRENRKNRREAASAEANEI